MTTAIRNPSFRTAGKSIVQGPTDNTASCLSTMPVVHETPDHIKKYRKSFKQQHGTTILHHGLVDAPKPPSNFVFGKKTAYSDKLSDTLIVLQGGVRDVIIDIKEKGYASRKKEPLGSMPTRDYNWPLASTQPGFQFGTHVIPSSHTCKEVIFPTDFKRESSADHQRYVKSHGNYEVGEQVVRNYTWDLDPKIHRFGKLHQPDLAQMKKVLYQEGTKDAFPQTKIIQKNQDDFNAYKDDPLGKPKNLAQNNPYVANDTIYGRTKQQQEWNAAECLRGQATMMEVQTDYDLGVAAKSGWKNSTKVGDENRTFGVPTIRNDIIRKQIKSMADHQNYGDEKPAVAVVFPEKFSFMGLSESDFLKQRTRDEIKSIFESVGIKYGIGKFNAIYKRAQTIEQNDEDDLMCVKAFYMAVQEMHDIQ